MALPRSIQQPTQLPASNTNPFNVHPALIFGGAFLILTLSTIHNFSVGYSRRRFSLFSLF